jgi:hypothetical protein
MIYAEKVANSCAKVIHFLAHVGDQAYEWLDHYLSLAIEIPRQLHFNFR